MACESCPFAETELSLHAQNLGCLPTPQEIMRIYQDNGKNWSCHADETRLCGGFARTCVTYGITLDRDAPLASYNRWYHTGAA